VPLGGCPGPEKFFPKTLFRQKTHAEHAGSIYLESLRGLSGPYSRLFNTTSKVLTSVQNHCESNFDRTNRVPCRPNRPREVHLARQMVRHCKRHAFQIWIWSRSRLTAPISTRHMSRSRGKIPVPIWAVVAHVS